MENGLNQHYATLLGLGEEWRVANVDLNVLGRRIDIYLEYAKDCAPCPECGTLCSVYDQQPERVWRHLDTMQFETLIHAKTPRVRCERHKVRVMETLRKHLYGLLAWFDSRIDNALTEGFNTTIQALKATAKGYRNFENFRIAILFYCGKLDMRPDFVRVGASC